MSTLACVVSGRRWASRCRISGGGGSAGVVVSRPLFATEPQPVGKRLIPRQGNIRIVPAIVGRRKACPRRPAAPRSDRQIVERRGIRRRERSVCRARVVRDIDGSRREAILKADGPRPIGQYSSEGRRADAAVAHRPEQQVARRPRRSSVAHRTTHRSRSSRSVARSLFGSVANSTGRTWPRPSRRSRAAGAPMSNAITGSPCFSAAVSTNDHVSGQMAGSRTACGAVSASSFPDPPTETCHSPQHSAAAVPRPGPGPTAAEARGPAPPHRQAPARPAGPC